ncbi:N-acyl homoserine lactonase family protein [Dactylosporangium maewongense]|uniref:N-acyl homoserine lactonase family protein n=1 Tax=Dactylosporangium maewongense TaxID=634393 RepID=A0ABP4NTF6_9ACTN
MTTVPQYTVTAVRLGTMVVDRSALTFGAGAGEPVEIPTWGAAVQAGSTRMLIDTGLAEPERWNERFPCAQPPSETLPRALAELGWHPNDVDVVINSHLHFDHAGNNVALPNAQFYVSAAEWEFARNPVATQAWSYDFGWTDEAVTYMQYRFVGTDHFDVLPGIRIIATPGHTPGHQSVLVQTAEGVLCVAGDAACLVDNFRLPAPPGVVENVTSALTSLRKIASLADAVLINHDPTISSFQSAGFPRLTVPSEPSSA